MTKISAHISYGEATKSQTATRKGIDNKPSEVQLKNMKLVANNCFEPLRVWHGKPIGVSSFLRSKELNAAVGGSTSSQHMQGEFTGKEEGAIDIDADMFNNGITNREIFDWLWNNVDFDQLIWEYGDNDNPAWVHVSYRKGANRRQVLKCTRVNGKPNYDPYER